ncbi:uncharacterized protein LOC127860694 [Dreissena polymorpha]|uniref:Uncharacterized protein n=1 Tax=Dreissena polymorpha TaxID=45954 RepID=A0A9D3YTZ6_DREPO|nr:uncharacterized protein LOC127860694 [Dreissena polymorpha]XP_052254894.1 uncharacterized protein LOC127860694 [Dreissena polymorpha]XP_052254895.1 uncharacterized protein LOC127860694 [Dreissena polymorpha]KAH3704501.1 hypothetical protein DPMN_079557 [Dreissena polymorpha]
MKNPFMMCMRQNSTANDIVRDWTYESFIVNGQENVEPEKHPEFTRASFYDHQFTTVNGCFNERGNECGIQAALCDRKRSTGLTYNNERSVRVKDWLDTNAPRFSQSFSEGPRNGPKVHARDWRDREIEKTQIQSALREFMARRGIEWQQQALIARSNPDANNSRQKERPVTRSVSSSQAPFSLTDINKLYAQKTVNVYR